MSIVNNVHIYLGKTRKSTFGERTNIIWEKDNLFICGDIKLRYVISLLITGYNEFFFEIEKAFGTKIPEEDISDNELLNISKIVKYIEQKINNGIIFIEISDFLFGV